MKRLLFLCSILFSQFFYASDFEGKIIYQNSYTTKIPQLSDARILALLGDRQDYYYKAGAYKSTTNGTNIQWQLYVPKDNKVYLKLASSETVLWNNASKQEDKVLSVTLNKKVVEVLGYMCDELILTCESGVQKYYFNSAIGVDANLFKQHTYANWWDYLSRAKALPLKMDIETSQFVIHSVAVSVQAMALEDSFFKLEEGVKTQENTN